MKQIALLLVALVVVSCMEPMKEKNTTQRFVVKGTINGEFSDFINISYNDKVDSVKVNNNSFQFEGEVSSPKAFQFKFDSVTFSEVFYLENDTLLFDIVVNEAEVDSESYNDYEINLLQGGTTQQLKAEVEAFLAETPRSKLNRDLILKTMDSLIKVHPNHDYLGKILSELCINQDLLYNDVRSLLYELDKDELNQQNVELLENYLDKRRNFQIGSEIPTYQLIDITANTVELTSELNTYNLLVFWNSWCEDCISQQEELQEIYKKFNFKGFEVISISLDTNQDDWISAVTTTSKPWLSLRIENGFTGDMASEMGIVDLPQYYLIDKNGRILEINLSMDELNTILTALLN